MRLFSLKATMIPRYTLADSVYQALLEAIVKGEIEGGTELNAVALSHELGVSRTPVNEALGRLVHDGLVEQEVNRKAKVLQVTDKTICEIYEVRKVLEMAAAQRAATRIEHDRLQDLRRSTETLCMSRESPEWPAKAREFDLNFHEAVASASGNARLRDEIARYRLLVRAFCQISGNINLEKAFKEHLAILQALEARDPEASRLAMAAHIESRLQAVLRELYSDRAATLQDEDAEEKPPAPKPSTNFLQGPQSFDI